MTIWAFSNPSRSSPPQVRLHLRPRSLLAITLRNAMHSSPLIRAGAARSCSSSTIQSICRTCRCAQGTNVVRYLEQAALAGRFQEFTTLLQQSLGTSRALTGRIIADPLGEPFAVSAKAMAIPTDAFQRILMFLNPSISHSVDRVYELSDLFEELPLPAALQMVAIWRAADRMEARKASHRPLHWPEAGQRMRDKTVQDQQRTDEQATTTNVTQRRTPSGA